MKSALPIEGVATRQKIKGLDFLQRRKLPWMPGTRFAAGKLGRR